MTSYTTRMPAGFAGQISRDPQAAVIETELLASTNVPAAFGLPLVDAGSNQLRGFISGDVAAAVVGFGVRPFPFQSSGNAYGAVAPTASQQIDRLRKGYFMGICAYGTPTLDGVVYVRLDTGGHGGTIGQLEATSDTSHNSAVTGARWTGPASNDGTGTAELAFNM